MSPLLPGAAVIWEGKRFPVERWLQDANSIAACHLVGRAPRLPRPEERAPLHCPSPRPPLGAARKWPTDLAGLQNDVKGEKIGNRKCCVLHPSPESGCLKGNDLGGWLVTRQISVGCTAELCNKVRCPGTVLLTDGFSRHRPHYLKVLQLKPFTTQPCRRGFACCWRRSKSFLSVREKSRCTYAGVSSELNVLSHLPLLCYSSRATGFQCKECWFMNLCCSFFFE